MIGDFFTFPLGAKVNGNVTIGDHAFIGSGTVLHQGIIVGAGAIVGNIARPLIKD